MNKTTVLTSVVLAAAVGLAAACSGGRSETAETSNSGKATTAVNAAPAASTGAANTAANAGGSDEETPASVKAAFPDAQSFTKSHKQISPAQLATLEKEAGVKPPDTDHHAFLAISSTGGARKQIGAASVVKANGKDVTIVYENKEGKPTIREVRADGVAAPFLSQFAGKIHDDKFRVGDDLKLNGADDAAAKAIADAVRVDILTMQTLYGAAESH